MMGKRRTDRELHWRGVLQRQSDSGLSIATFCRQESISAPSFYAWRRKLKERDAGALGSGFQERAASSDAQLLPVRIESGASLAPVRIFLPGGAWIDAPSNMDRRALVELLEALREAQLCC